MRKFSVNPGQSGRSDRASQRHFTVLRIAVGVMSLALLLISAAGVLIITTRSYAAATAALDACETTTATPASSSPTTVGAKATATPRRRRTPAPTPTDDGSSNPTATPTSAPTATPTSVPTATPTSAPTATPTSAPTATPTSAPTATSTATSTSQSRRMNATSFTGSIVLLSARMLLTAATPLNAHDQCASTPTSTGDTQTPGPNSTTIANGSTPGTTPVTTASHSQSARNTNGGSPMVIIVGGVFLLLLVGLGIGWLFFRRMLLPANALNAQLPPSGARPWSRTRVPNPNSAIGMVNDQAEQKGGPGMFEPGGPGPNRLPETPTSNDAKGFDLTGFSSLPGGNAGFGSFSDGFIPPSPQIFSQNENSMIPPGSGAFPIVANGVPPLSPAFNGMYGLPDDPFASSQGGTSGWMANLGKSNNANALPTPAPNGEHFAPSQEELNDPHLAEVIRHYSQKSQVVRLQQMSPTNPPTSPMPQRKPDRERKP